MKRSDRLGLFLALVFLGLLAGCSRSGGGGSSPTGGTGGTTATSTDGGGAEAEGSLWDKMQWDKGKWG